MAAIVLSGLSFLFQLYAAILAVRLCMVTRHRLAWGCVAVGLLLIMFRRVFELAAYLNLNSLDTNLTFTITSFLVSISMAVGMHLAKRMIDRMTETTAQLSVSEAYHRVLMEYGTEAIFVADRNGNYVTANLRGLEMYGYTLDQLTRLNIIDVVDADEIARTPLKFDELRDGKVLVTHRTQICADGHRFVAEIHTRQLPDGNIMSSVRDITSHLLAEAKLRFQADLLDTVQQAVVVCDLQGQIIYYNQYASEMYGWSPESVLGLRVEQALRSSLTSEIIEQVQACLVSGQRWTGEIRYQDDAGNSHPAMLIQSPLFDKDMTRIGSIGVSFDISDLQAAEQSAARADNLLREFIDTAPFGAHHYELKPDGALLFTGANQTAERLLHFDHSPLIGKPIEEAFPGVVESSLPDVYRSVALTGVAWDSSQVRYKGGIIDGAYEVSAFQTGPNRMVALFKDITDRVRAEEALRQREIRLQIANDIARGIVAHESPESIIEYALMSIFQAFPSYRVSYAEVSPSGNWHAKRSLQPTGIDSLNGAQFEFDRTADMWNRLRHQETISISSTGSVNADHLLLKVFGETDAVAFVLCAPITLEGHLIGTLAFDSRVAADWNEHETKLLHEVANYLEIVFRDARQNERRIEAEDALRISEERFRMALQNSPIVMFHQDKDLRYTWNYNPKDPKADSYIIGRTDYQILPTESADRLTKIKREVMATRSGQRFETEVFFRGETTFWDCCIEPLIDKHGEVIGVSGVSSNITERRLIETELRDSEERFRTLADNLPAFVWLSDCAGNGTYFNRPVLEATGSSHEDLAGQKWHHLIHPDDRENYLALGQSAMSACLPFESTVRLRAADGTYRHVINRAVPHLDQRGQVIGYVGTCIDITERMDIESALRESERRFHAMADCAPVMIWQSDMTAKCDYFNKVWLDFTGRTLEEEVGDGWADSVHPDDLAPCVSGYMDSFSKREPFELLYRLRRHDGEYRWILDRGTPRNLADGNFAGYIGSCIDITEHREAEIRLRESEARFHAFMDNNPAVAFMKDRDGKYLYLNAAFARTFNISIADWLGRDDFAFWPREVAEALQQADREVLASGQPTQYVERIPHADGEHQWLSYKFPILDRNGRPDALAGIAIDLTDQFRTQSELQASEHRHRSLVDLLPDGLYIQCDGIVMYANASLAEMLGYASPEELVGKHVLDLFHSNSHALVRHRLALLDSGVEKLPVIEEQLRKADGSPLDAEVKAVRTTWSGRPGVQVIARDITERKMAEADRIHLEEQLRLSQKLETIGTMAAGIAHDFNNLLVPIIGYSELVASEVPPDRFSGEYLQEVLKAAYRAKGLVSQILAFSRQQTGDRAPIQIDTVIGEVIAILKQGTVTNIQFTHVTSDKIVPVMADATQLVQVLRNILVNATQAMSGGGEITITSAPWDPGLRSCQNCKRTLHGKMVHIEITDTGCGMDPATLARIFDPFFSTKGVGKGAGLGLAVTHGIVTQHSGHICAQSKLGEGSTFHLFLPIADAMLPRFHPELPPAVPGGTESILIVDDEAAVANSHASTLKSLGYKATVAIEPHLALAIFRQDPGGFDAVLLDQRMPDITGDQLAVEFLRIRPNTPIIICSGFSDSLNLRSARDLGICDVIMKPVVASELNRVLRMALDGRQPIPVS